ncbi:IS66 family insertion sequence element accessory protein TnpB [Paraliomyxa miuraensis]|uniref:IS66 family insertion sequence element accessory protein TnpB n=1 Tax=Paraliomyxa miuraensis TaxID=376150 RepID=UPI00225742AC|nr:IS66 family insertion sequence element accessory protein TnpB [Paraliomyxa miuraensis]MCX4239043.1 IS66 family insertion sequence element accessory protein TnpB [Paraliomyxa miuraensis]
MLTLPSGARMFMATQPVDLRRSYDGLCAIVEGTFGRSARSGDLFVFINRRANQVRILFWDRDGYCIVMKRLEAGTFRRLEGRDGEDHIEIDAGELAMLLEGIDAPVIKRRKRYRMLAPATNEHVVAR